MKVTLRRLIMKDNLAASATFAGAGEVKPKKVRNAISLWKTLQLIFCISNELMNKKKLHFKEIK